MNGGRVEREETGNSGDTVSIGIVVDRYDRRGCTDIMNVAILWRVASAGIKSKQGKLGRGFQR